MRHPAAIALLAAAPLAASPAMADVRASFLYPLSDMAGQVQLGWTSMVWDPGAAELYVVDDHNGVVDVFNDNGVIVYSFGDTGFGGVRSVAVREDGSPLVLAYGPDGYSIVRCNFRGEPLDRVELRNLPPNLGPGAFHPDGIFLAGGSFYLADKGSLTVAIFALDGSFRKSLDLARLIELPERERGQVLIRSLTVDRGGSIYFTVAELFRAFIVSPDGDVRSFGGKGSVPGKFNVAGGIATDEEGHVFVADTLRCAVMVFNRQDLAFLGEFGSRGRLPRNLINPLDIAVGNGRVFVTQSTGAVKVFGVLFE